MKPQLKMLNFSNKRSMSSFLNSYYDSRYTTSSMFCLIRNPLYSRPFISISNNMEIPIEEGKNIQDLEDYSKQKYKLASLDFYTHNRVKIGKHTCAETLSSLPYFVLIVNGVREYFVISEKSFSFQNQKYEMSGNEKKFYDY
jgi:hypothetical protein